MAAKIGGFLGVFAGWLTWQTVGGIAGLLLATFLVIPIASVVFIAAFSALGRLGGGGPAAVVSDKEVGSDGNSERR